MKLQLTVRAYEEKVRQQMLASIARIARGIALAAGVPDSLAPIVQVSETFTPATYNDPELTRRLAGVFAQVFGPEKVLQRPPVMGGEDFGRLGLEGHLIPGCIFWIGAVDPVKIEHSRKTGAPLPSLHSPLFAPLPEPTIRTGVKAMTAAVLELMKE